VTTNYFIPISPTDQTIFAGNIVNLAPDPYTGLFAVRLEHGAVAPTANGNQHLPPGFMITDTRALSSDQRKSSVLHLIDIEARRFAYAHRPDGLSPIDKTNNVFHLDPESPLGILAEIIVFNAIPWNCKVQSQDPDYFDRLLDHEFAGAPLAEDLVVRRHLRSADIGEAVLESPIFNIEERVPRDRTAYYIPDYIPYMATEATDPRQYRNGLILGQTRAFQLSELAQLNSSLDEISEAMCIMAAERMRAYEELAQHDPAKLKELRLAHQYLTEWRQDIFRSGSANTLIHTTSRPQLLQSSIREWQDTRLDILLRAGGAHGVAAHANSLDPQLKQRFNRIAYDAEVRTRGQDIGHGHSLAAAIEWSARIGLGIDSLEALVRRQDITRQGHNLRDLGWITYTA